jgi:hypothetical protein
MAKQTEPKGWAQECLDGIELEVHTVVRAKLKEQLDGVMRERPLKAGEVSKLATALLELPKNDKAEEKAA